VLVAPGHHLADLFGGRRHDHDGRLADVDAAVVGDKRFGIGCGGQAAMRADNGLHGLKQNVLGGQGGHRVNQ
jgi:hypothetical protein